MAGIYIHIPFCASRCIYCDYYSTVGLAVADRYVDAVVCEAGLRAHELAQESVRTLYVGGGTPSLLTADQWLRLVQGVGAAVDLSAMEEFTVEVNPDDVTDGLVQCLSSLGVNRVSMGVQSMVDDELRFINRRHTASQVVMAVQCIHEKGIDNVSLDLIYGIPGQTLASWQQSVARALRLDIKHISAYNLSYEPGTRLWQMREQGLLSEVDDEMCLAMYQSLCQTLSGSNFEHYEISNFALPGYHSQHNSAYWEGTPYLGLGAAAHSFDGHVRRYNPAHLKRYMKSLAAGKTVCEAERMEWWECYDEMVMVRLRTARGLDAAAVHKRFGDDVYRHLVTAAKPHEDRGLLHRVGDTYVLTPDGVMMSDAVIRDLMWDG